MATRTPAEELVEQLGRQFTLPEGLVPRGGLRKIADAPRPCMHPGHGPPSHIVLEPGTYQHTCPGCGKSCTFTVQGVYL